MAPAVSWLEPRQPLFIEVQAVLVPHSLDMVGEWRGHTREEVEEWPNATVC